MEELVSLLNEFYITPHVEDDELLGYVSSLYQDLTPKQKDLCGQIQELYANRSFLLGLRTGVDLERFLRETPQATH